MGLYCAKVREMWEFYVQFIQPEYSITIVVAEEKVITNRFYPTRKHPANTIGLCFKIYTGGTCFGVMTPIFYNINLVKIKKGTLIGPKFVEIFKMSLSI